MNTRTHTTHTCTIHKSMYTYVCMYVYTLSASVLQMQILTLIIPVWLGSDMMGYSRNYTSWN